MDLAPFLRYGDLLAENCEFFLPHCYLFNAVARGFTLSNFWMNVLSPRLESLRYPSACEDFVILVCVVLTHFQRVTDRRTDRQTHRRTDNSTVAIQGSALSYAHAL